MPEAHTIILCQSGDLLICVTIEFLVFLHVPDFFGQSTPPKNRAYLQVTLAFGILVRRFVSPVIFVFQVHIFISGHIWFVDCLYISHDCFPLTLLFPNFTANNIFKVHKTKLINLSQNLE